MPEIDWVFAFAGFEGVVITFLVTKLLEYKTNAKFWEDTYFKYKKPVKDKK